ncbi:hypothetical protein BIW11_03871 [Tropilaelaps mercedesae]|uniref:Uncharacterized protein n=1 Tax=Tropilaelaps mercedesae TaxID=418985 RepID=A0A1V9XEJ8_9ACAR|nr:hypothetical protein BIW11_03871 [Tropilaelaps mercedesae]
MDATKVCEHNKPKEGMRKISTAEAKYVEGSW